MSDVVWTDSELETIGRVEEIRLATRRKDGSLRAPVTIWIGESDGQVYVRSGNGVDGSWYRFAVANAEGRVDASGLSVDVVFEPVTDSAIVAAVSAAYRQKYGRYEKIYGQPIVTPQSESATLRLNPQR
jgi:hypothetical protein